MMKKLLLTISPAKRFDSAVLSFKSLFIAMVLMMGFVSVEAQVRNYTFSGTGTGVTYTTLVGANNIAWTGPVATTAWNDNTPSNVPIGFTFNFNGIDYTTVNVSTNGFITFGATAPTTTNYAPIASAQAYDGAIAVYGNNLVNNLVSIRYLTQGAFPNRTFTVEYLAYRTSTGGTTSTGTMTMQIILREGTNVIDLMYKTNSASAFSANAVGQIGLRGENNTDFSVMSQTLFTTAWPSAVYPSGAMTSSTVNTALTNASTVATKATGTAIPATRMTWTPPSPVCFPPRALAFTNPSTGVYNLSWTAPASPPDGGYEYYWTTTAPTTAASIPTASPSVVSPTSGSGTVAAGVTSVSVPGLPANTTLYFYVRSICGGTPGGWSSSISGTTLCTSFPDPFLTSVNYIQDFDASTVGVTPLCNTIINSAADPVGVWKTSDMVVYPGGFGFFSRHINAKTSSLNNNNTTYFTEGISLTGGQSYRLSYRYGADNQFATTEQNMIVQYGTAPLVASMTVTLQDHPALKGGPYTNVINFIPATSGVYYFGFNDYSVINNATLFLDDINLGITTCFAPTLNAVTGITSGGGTISWNAPSPAPSGGYQYYLTDVSSANPPSGATPIINTSATTVTLAGLSPLTTYYYWVRSSCGGTESSGWSLQGTFTTLAGAAPASCTPSGAGYPQDPNGITNVTFSNVNNTTGIEPNNYGDYTALVGYVGQGTTVPVAITYRTGYTYDTKIWIDWNNNGTFVDAGENVYTGVSTAANPTVLSASFNVPLGATLGQHRMRIGGIDFGPFSTPATDPCRTGNYQAYEDYSCWVTTPPPALTLSSYSTTACANVGFGVTITSAVGNYSQYTWAPATGVTGTAASGYTLNPTVSTTYVLTANNPASFQTVTKTFVYTVNPAPSAVTVTPATGSICSTGGTSVLLTATGGSIGGAAIYSENFNGLAPGWVQTSNQPAGDWVLGPDGYAPFFTAIHSNDNSQFAMTESDAPGSGTTTNTTLTSPAINLTGYTTASLSFWQFYKYYNGPEGGQLQISTTSATGPFTTLQTYGSSGNLGSESAFVNSVIDLTSYAVANNTIYIRFKYDATWDWGWAIDNFVITGSGPSTITWAPTTGLYTDAAHTNPYGGGAATSVYAFPGSTTTYVATATGLGCTTASNNAVITVASCGPCPTSTTWNGTAWSNSAPTSTVAAIFAGNYTFASAFPACSLTVNSGILTVNPGVTLTIENQVAVTGGSLTFESGSSLVQVNSTTANTGNIVYKRDISVRKFDYTYWSSPVQAQNLRLFSPTTLIDKYWYWNATSYSWISVDATVTNMNVAQGYIIRAPNAFSTTSFTPWTGIFTGVPHNGDYTVPIVVSGANNLNLLGNPYASAISADLFMSNASNSPALSTAGTTLYFWTHNTAITNNVYTDTDYAAYNYTGGIGTAGVAGNNSTVPSGKIAAGQGFMVKGVQSGNVTFKNSMRLSGFNNNFYRQGNQASPTEIEKNRVWLELKNSSGAYKQVLVGYIEGATNSYDNGFDGEILEAGNTVSFYSVLNASKLSIQGRGLPFDVNDQVALGYKTSAATSFEINLSNFDGLFAGQDVYLEDHLLNVIHDLKASPYLFVTEIGTFDTRFVLRFTNSTLGVSTPALTENAVVVFKNNRDIHVETSNIVMKSVKIYDTRGRLILERNNVNSSRLVFEGVNVGHQVLLVQITAADNTTVSKKIIF